MIDINQVHALAKQYKVHETVVAREFIQLVFLSELYKHSLAKQIFFKGGTAIRLVYGGERFSEDLDFTLTVKMDEFMHFFTRFTNRLAHQHPFSFKEKRSITGKTYLLTATLPFFKQSLYVRLDFSVREPVLKPTQTILKTDYPVIIHNYIHTLDKDEILAEKIRAILTRKKSRDLYDLWMLQELGAKLDLNLINQKLAYYNLSFSKEQLRQALNNFSQEDFMVDLRPFVPLPERSKLAELFNYIQAYLHDTLLSSNYL